MARQMELETEEKKDIKVNPFKKFIFLIIIPLLFALIVALIVAAAAGVNILNEAKSISQTIPFTTGLFPKESQSNGKQTGEQELKQLQTEVKDRDQQISQLQSKLASQDQELQKAQLENSDMQQKIEDLNNSQKQSTRKLQDIVTSYQTMSPKNAASIISKMSDTEALQILTNIKPEILASIMENMDPAQAARFTELMTNKNGTNQSGTNQ